MRSCTEFKECLIDSDNKVLIEATTDDCWASGLNVNITKCTNINFIPGQNTLGKILMAEREVCFKEENHARELQEAIDFQNEKTDSAKSLATVAIEKNGTASIEAQIRKSRSILKIQHHTKRSSFAPSKKLTEAVAYDHYKEDIMMHFTKKRAMEISPNKGENEKVSKTIG